MQSSARLALDSMPLTDVCADCRDHSGSQVFALTSAPLVAFSSYAETRPPRGVAARIVSSSKDGKRHRFVLRDELRWSDGAAAVPAQFYEPLVRVLQEFPSTVESFWFSDVCAITPTRHGFEVCTSRPNYRFPALTSLLRVAASCAPRGATASESRAVTEPRLGRYHVTKYEAGSIRLRANRYWEPLPPELDLRHDSLEFVRVQDPDENVAQFESEEIDLSADTAFPYHRVPEFLADPRLRISRSGIFASLGFEGKLAEAESLPLRARIRAAVDVEALCLALAGVLIPRVDYLPSDVSPRRLLERATGALRVPPVALARNPRARALRLAYDAYYPNLEICAVLAVQLRAAGLEVELVQDSFENPSQAADLRLVLGKAVHPGELGMYYGLFCLDSLRSHPEDCHDYLMLLRAAQETPVLSRLEVKHTGALLQAILDRRAAIVPLAEIPGIALSRFTTCPFGDSDNDSE